MEQQSSDETSGQGACQSVADKIEAATQLLVSAFEDARTDSNSLSKGELLEQIMATQQLTNTVWAVQSVRLAQVAATEEVMVSDSTSPGGVREHLVRHPIGSHQEEFIGAEIGPLLGWSPRQATGRVTEATDVITRTPRLFARVGTGELEPGKLLSIHRALGRVMRWSTQDGDQVEADLAAAVQNALLGDPDDPESPAAGSEEFAAAEQANADLLARSTTAAVGGRTQRILTALDPVAADKAATRRRRDRVGVFTHPDDEPGLTHLHAILPSDAATKMMAAIDKHARELHTATTTDKTLAECRADAIADLILNNAQVTTHLVVQVPIHPTRPTTTGTTPAGAAFETVFGTGSRPGPSSSTSTGLGTAIADRVVDQDAVDREFNQLLIDTYGPGPDADYFWELQGCSGPPDDPPTPPPYEPPASARMGDATVPGIGVIPAAVIEAMTRQFGTTISRSLIDATTGITLETCEQRYRPSPQLARFIKTRDQHCRFPGCTHPATRCDIDHVTPWPHGPTTAANLQTLCRHHHRTKQSHGWTITMTPQGVCTWTSPTGHTYTTTPGE